MSVQVKVTGAKELRRSIRQIEDAAAKKGMQGELKTAYRTAARVVEIAAKGEAPKRSGRLAGTIKAKGTTTGAAVTAGGTKRVPYAGPIHWGWPSRPNRPRGWRGGPISANKFMVRAAMDSRDVVKEVLEDELNKVLKRVMPSG